MLTQPYSAANVSWEVALATRAHQTSFSNPTRSYRDAHGSHAGADQRPEARDDDTGTEESYSTRRGRLRRERRLRQVRLYRRQAVTDFYVCQRSNPQSTSTRAQPFRLGRFSATARHSSSSALSSERTTPHAISDSAFRSSVVEFRSCATTAAVPFKSRIFEARA